MFKKIIILLFCSFQIQAVILPRRTELMGMFQRLEEVLLEDSVINYEFISIEEAFDVLHYYNGILELCLLTKNNEVLYKDIIDIIARAYQDDLPRVTTPFGNYVGHLEDRLHDLNYVNKLWDILFKTESFDGEREQALIYLTEQKTLLEHKKVWRLDCSIQ